MDLKNFKDSGGFVFFVTPIILSIKEAANILQELSPQVCVLPLWFSASWHFDPVLGKQRIPDNPSLDPRSYEVKRLESGINPVTSNKQGQGIVFATIVRFSDLDRI